MILKQQFIIILNVYLFAHVVCFRMMTVQRCVHIDIVAVERSWMTGLTILWVSRYAAILSTIVQIFGTALSTCLPLVVRHPYRNMMRQVYRLKCSAMIVSAEAVVRWADAAVCTIMVVRTGCCEGRWSSRWRGRLVVW